MADKIVGKDAYLVQAIGGSTKYGNGDGDLLHVGRLPSGSGAPDWKSRSVFEVELRTVAVDGILDGLSSLSAATIELTVAASTCIVNGRGANFYAFLEEITTDFDEKATASDCTFNSGSGIGVWGADSGATTTNRAFESAPGLATSDKVEFNILAMAQAWLADASKLKARFRVIFANSAGTAYDESSGAAKGTAFYAREHATSGNRPVLHVTGSAGAVDQDDTDTITIGDSDATVIVVGGPDVADTDMITITDTHVQAGATATWYVEVDETGAGRGKVSVPAFGSYNALLDGVSEEDVAIKCRFSLSKIPSNQSISWWLLARVVDATRDYYGCLAGCSNFGGGESGIALHIVKRVANVTTSIGIVPSGRALLANTYYWVKFLVFGTSPTTLAAKLWRDGETEPSGYQVTAQDSEAALQVADTVGIRASASSVNNLPIIISFDDFEVVAP